MLAGLLQPLQGRISLTADGAAEQGEGSFDIPAAQPKWHVYLLTCTHPNDSNLTFVARMGISPFPPNTRAMGQHSQHTALADA